MRVMALTCSAIQAIVGVDCLRTGGAYFGVAAVAWWVWITWRDVIEECG